MRVWIYSRLSNDDDPEQNSLTNQERICREHAKQNGCTVVGSSSDDNISGMTFPRPGLRKLSEAAENGSMVYKIHRIENQMIVDVTLPKLCPLPRPDIATPVFLSAATATLPSSPSTAAGTAKRALSTSAKLICATARPCAPPTVSMRR